VVSSCWLCRSALSAASPAEELISIGRAAGEIDDELLR